MSAIGHATQVKPSACPFCGTVNNATTGVGGDWNPEPGDAAVCLNCCNLAVLGDDLTLREPTDAELDELACDPIVKRAIFWGASAKAHKEATDEQIEAVRRILPPVTMLDDNTLGLIVDRMGRPAWNDAKVFGVLIAAKERGALMFSRLEPPAYARFEA